MFFSNEELIEVDMNVSTEGVKLVKSCFVAEVEFKMVVGMPYKQYLSNDAIGSAVNTILAITAIFLNSVMVIGYWKSSKLKEKVSYFLITVLCFVDLAVGIISGSLMTLFLVSRTIGAGNCEILFAYRRISVLLSGLSVATLSALNIERYLAILHPLLHRTKVTKKRLLILVVLMSSGFLVTLFLSFVDERISRISTSFNIVLFSIITVFIYIRIYFRSRQSRKVNRLENATGDIVFSQHASEMGKKRRLLEDIKLAKSYFLVVICFCICFIPRVIATAINAIDFKGLLVNVWTTILILMNSSLNSVIFFWKNQRLRNEATSIVKQTFCNRGINV